MMLVRWRLVIRFVSKTFRSQKIKTLIFWTDLEAVVATVTAVHNNVPETDEEADAEEAK